MLRGRGEGLEVDEAGEPTAVNMAADHTPVRLTRRHGTRQDEHVPTQSWNATHLQWNKGACDGFVAGIEQTEPGLDATAGMRYWNEQDLPFYYGLAKTFPVADHWFSSCLGPGADVPQSPVPHLRHCKRSH
jgi:phospholipase C